MKKIIYQMAIITAFLVSFQTFTLGVAGSALSAASPVAQKNLAKLVESRSCRGCDLAGLDFNRMDLSGVDLEEADLSSGQFYLTNLTGANLQKAKLNGAIFGGADLGEADLRGADLEGASLDGAYLGEAIFDSELIAGTPSEKVIASPVDGPQIESTSRAAATKKPEEVIEVSADATAPKLNPMGAPQPTDETINDSEVKQDLAAKDNDMESRIDNGKQEEIEKNQGSEELAVDKNNLKNTEVSDNSQGSGLTEVEAKPIPKADVAMSAVMASEHESGGPLAVDDSSQNDLGADIIKKNNLDRLLDKDRCFGCDLSGLDLSGKNLKGVDLEKADLSGCNLEDAKLDGANLKGALLQGVNLRNASLKKADLYKADLTDADLTDADVKDTMFDGANISKAIGLVISSETLMSQ